jgi:hypothetical protein
MTDRAWNYLKEPDELPLIKFDHRYEYVENSLLEEYCIPTRERKLIEELDMLRYEQKCREGDEIKSLFTSSGGFNMAQVKHFVQKKWGSSLPSSSLDRISHFIETVEEGRKRKRLLCMTGGDIERLFERVLSRACTPERLWQPKPEPKYGIRSLEGICMLPSITRTVDINSLNHCCLELDRRLLISNTAWSRENEWLRYTFIFVAEVFYQMMTEHCHLRLQESSSTK